MNFTTFAGVAVIGTIWAIFQFKKKNLKKEHQYIIIFVLSICWLMIFTHFSSAMSGIDFEHLVAYGVVICFLIWMGWAAFHMEKGNLLRMQIFGTFLLLFILAALIFFMYYFYVE